MSDLSSFLSASNKSGWSAKLWDGFIEAVQARLAPLEENLGIQREITDAIIARGLTVIEQELAPIVRQAEVLLGETSASLDAKLQRFEHKVTGGTVIALSSTPSQLREGEDISIYLDAVDREFFAPTPYISISRASTVSNWAIAKLKSFNRSTGLLVATLEKVETPGGPYNDWVLTSLPGATFLQKYYYEQTVALRQAVGRDKEDTKADRQAVSTMRDEAQTARTGAATARAGSEQALADLRKAVAPPITAPSNPVEGQLWWDGTIMRVFKSGVGYVPTVTVSIGGRRYERGSFGANSDGVITVGGGFTAAMVFVNGQLLDEGTDYTADSPTITVLNPTEGDRYFVEAYLSTDAVDYYTKEQVDNKVGKPNGLAGLDDDGKVPAAQLPEMKYLPLNGGRLTGGVTVQADDTFGTAALVSGDNVHTGYLEGKLPNGKRGYYLGWAVAGGRALFVTENGLTGLEITGSLVVGSGFESKGSGSQRGIFNNIGAGDSWINFHARDAGNVYAEFGLRSSGIAYTWVNGNQFDFRPNGQFWAATDLVAKGVVYAGSGTAQLQQNGNVVGSIWNNYGFGTDAYTAITNRIEQRARDFADDRLNQARAYAEDRSFWRTQDFLISRGVDDLGMLSLVAHIGGGSPGRGAVWSGNDLGPCILYKRRDNTQPYLSLHKPSNFGFGSWRLSGGSLNATTGSDQFVMTAYRVA